MILVKQAIRFPVSTTVGVVLLLLFGVISLRNIPVQLTPDMEETQVQVTTTWPGASPHEIEREIVEEQEDYLKSLEGLVRMESTSEDGTGTITLTFLVGTDYDAAVLRVANALEQVPSYPADAEKPVLSSLGAAFRAIAWFVLVPTKENGFRGDVSTLYDFVDDRIRPRIERVPGVSRSNFFGGRKREFHVTVDPALLAARQITMTQLAAALESENRSFSGGEFDEGKRRYTVRTIGEYESEEAVSDVVIAVRDGTSIRVGDVAEAKLGYRKPLARVYFKGEQNIAINAIKETGANVLSTMRQLKDAVAEMNSNLLADRGLELIPAYDETEYIESAISLVKQNLVIGGSLAIIVLLLFLRSPSSTFVVAVAIPISVVGTFLLMHLFGRSINVISLAGMAFAVGMVVDNSIVVLENIYRHRQMGKPRFEAALDGAREVWGAVLASTLTTIAVFVPVIFVQQEAGQLFRDIAIAISCAVALSLIVSMTVIPSLSARILHVAEDRAREHRSLLQRFAAFPASLGRRINDRIIALVEWIIRSIMRRLVVIVGLTSLAVGGSWLLVPKLEYLPTGNVNFLFGIVSPPPGYNIDEVSKMQDVYVEHLSPLWSKPAEESTDLAGGGVRNFFYVATPDQAFMGARANDPLRVRELVPVFFRANTAIPGVIAFTVQSSLFQRNLSQGRSVVIELTGPDLPHLMQLGKEVYGRVLETLPGAQAVPTPSLDLGRPEVRIYPHRQRAAEAGVTNRDLGFVVRALVDGAKASEYRHDGKEIDLVIRAHSPTTEVRTHRVAELPIATPDGLLVTLGSIAQIKMENGPVRILHRERQRALTISVSPREEQALQEVMETIDREILDPIRARGDLGGTYRAALSGSADKLSETADALFWNFILAIVITYLLMAALFESFAYPFVIMFSVPLAALGGFLGLDLVNRLLAYQALDILTMLGFIILVGTVVNNAILIVHQSLNLLRADRGNVREAVREATRSRIRPIFMSVSTSVFGMLPLVLFPGAGSELYRGLGSVVVGGLLVSTIFTLLLVPALLSLALEFQAGLRRRIG